MPDLEPSDECDHCLAGQHKFCKDRYCACIDCNRRFLRYNPGV